MGQPGDDPFPWLLFVLLVSMLLTGAGVGWLVAQLVMIS